MRVVVALLSVALIVSILVEAFETIVQPRRVTRRYRLSRVYYAVFWTAWRWAADGLLVQSKRRAAFLSAFGPLSLLGIFTAWIVALIVGFGFLQWGLGDPVSVKETPGRVVGIGDYLYLSGSTFFTLGYGDATPTSPFGRLLSVAESGLGFGFLAAVLSYLPTLFQAYSKREVEISLLDARAGSPPTAAQLILRAARSGHFEDELGPFLGRWERWSAELLESQLSFPVLAFYRSQHDNQSWLAALTTVLDTCAVMLSQLQPINPYQAQMTFAIARHAAVDLALLLRARKPGPSDVGERLPAARFAALRSEMAAAGLSLREADGVEQALRALRETYEPFLVGLSNRLLLTVPPLMPDDDHHHGVPADNWQRSPWMKPTPGIGASPYAPPLESPPDKRHFE